ncbi:hypothetical protein G7K_5789-t1 [Saitoella complicata NRRL Y-17804]|uniref:Uncharacterized protein n=1 Tax=Saitoella complicata (strain BCRC 22490 / CBS 7301 / JCM 7358 / NBRC 10748 / NRRL Y-17804) TaxID=698492 RepID=A0A0E9NPT2_SAICN|nr:hypothetical protein G7K_5789-t1 [Saitoella complicata NRRL Y-17804]
MNRYSSKGHSLPGQSFISQKHVTAISDGDNPFSIALSTYSARAFACQTCNIHIHPSVHGLPTSVSMQDIHSTGIAVLRQSGERNSYNATTRVTPHVHARLSEPKSSKYTLEAKAEVTCFLVAPLKSSMYHYFLLRFYPMIVEHPLTSPSTYPNLP